MKYVFIKKTDFDFYTPQERKLAVSVSTFPNYNELQPMQLGSEGSEVDYYVLSFLEENVKGSILGNHTWLNAKDAREIISSGVYDEEVNYQVKDLTGRPVISTAIVPKGWAYHSPSFQVKSTRKQSFKFFNKFSEPMDDIPVGVNGAKILVMRLYDDKAGYESDTQSVDRATATMTVVRFTPPYDYYIVDGEISDSVKPLENFRVYAMLSPDIPYESGGSREFICCKNLKFGAKNDVKVDGRSPKFVPHIEVAPRMFTNTLEFTFTHPAGFEHEVEITIGLYRG